MGLELVGEALDDAVLAAVQSLIPGWLPEDDAFCPTEYWADCGPLIDLFDVDVGPHNGKWLAYCRLDQSTESLGDTAREAICRAVLKLAPNA